MFVPSSVSILSGSSETKKGASSPSRPSIASTMDKGMVSCVVLQPPPAPPETHNPKMKEERSASLRSPLSRRRATRRRPGKARGRGRGAAHAAARRLLVRRAVHVRRVAHVSAQPAGMCDDAPPSPPRALHPSPPPRPSKERSARRARRGRGDCGERVIILSPSLFVLRSLVCLFVRSFLPSLRTRRRRPRDCQSRAKNAVTMQLRNELRGSRRPKLFDRAEDVYFDFEVQY